MNSSIIYQTKRTLSTFSEKLTDSLPKPQKKFIHDMIYGLGKSTSVIVTQIARSLNEPISTFQTAKRLCRNLSEFDQFSLLHQNYIHEIKKQVQEDSLVIVDDSDITKPYGEQFEALGYVRDGSKGTIEKGYKTTNFSIASTKTSHPIPIYSHLYSAEEKGFESINVETAKGFNQTKKLFGDTPYTLVMDRGYDSNVFYQYFQHQQSQFITRLRDNRYLLYQGKRMKIADLASRRKGKINFQAEIKGKRYTLKISHIKVELPIMKGVPIYMVVVYGYGKKPLKLLTNKGIHQKSDVLRIVKAYITRWRIEELFRVQKQEFQLESVRTLSLNSLKLMYRLVNYLIGHYALCLEKESIYARQVLKESKSLKRIETIRFHLYRFIRGMSTILYQDKKGLKDLQQIEKRLPYNQLTLLL